jgi:LacI family transcriptional regulator
LLTRRPRPDAVFCHNDPTALGAIRAILKSGLRVPEDIAVIGCGNLHYNDLLQVPLSSIDQQTGRMGESAARLALRLLEEKPPAGHEHIHLEPRLVVRRSSAR